MIGIALLIVGVILLGQAQWQRRLLRKRIALGTGTIALDSATGMFSAAAAWQSIRAETNRSKRQERPLQLVVGKSGSHGSEIVDADGRALRSKLGSEVTAVRLSRAEILLMSCSDQPIVTTLPESFRWTSKTLSYQELTAEQVLRYIAEVLDV